MNTRTLPDPKPEPPREPELEECCGSGCSPCVFDRYEMALERYREALRAWEERQQARRPSPRLRGSGKKRRVPPGR